MSDKIAAAGARLVAIAPQSTAKNAEVKEQHKLTFPVLSDPGNAWSKEVGLVFALPEYLRPVYSGFGIVLPDFNGDDSWTLPMPSRMVVDTSGVIRAIEANPDYTLRPEPEATLEALAAL